MSNEFWDNIPKGHKHFVGSMGKEKLKRLANRFRRHTIRQLDNIPIIKTLDWGCGGGHLAKIISNFSEVILLDISEDSLQEALRYLAPLKPQTILFNNTTKIEFKPDLLVCYDVIHHFSSYEYWLRITKIWAKTGPKFIAMHAKIGTETRATDSYADYIDALILSQDDFLDPFEDYRIRYWAEEPQVKQTKTDAARPPKVWYHGFAVLERK